MIIEMQLAEFINVGLVAMVAIAAMAVMASQAINASANGRKMDMGLDADEIARLSKRIEGGYEYKNSVRVLIRRTDKAISRSVRAIAIATTEEQRNLFSEHLQELIELRDGLNELLLYRDRE